MKKNLMSVLILFLLLVNLIFTGLLTFSIMPAAKNANALIEEVAQAIHLELNAGKTTGQGNVSMANVKTYNVNGGETMTINLKKGEDGDDHYAVVGFYVNLNSENEDFAKVGDGAGDLSTSDSVIKNSIISAISAHTKEEMNDSEVQDAVCNDILEQLQALYDSDCIVGVGFSSILLQ